MLKKLRGQASHWVTSTFGASTLRREANRLPLVETASVGGTCDAQRAAAGAPLSVGESFLASQAVTHAVQDTYLRLVVTFLLFCELRVLTLRSTKD